MAEGRHPDVDYGFHNGSLWRNAEIHGRGLEYGKLVFRRGGFGHTGLGTQARRSRG